MNRQMWKAFAAARDRCREFAGGLGRELPELREIQQTLVDQRPGPRYTVETPVVYNTALDDISPDDEIRLILVADNPGRREQAACSRRYLIGPSGKIAESFFRNTPSLGIDFRRQAIILNKTPIHTPRTAELRELCRLGGPSLTKAVAASQEVMADLIAEFHRALAPVPVWIIGYSEMKKNGVFAAFTETLKALYRQSSPQPSQPSRRSPAAHQPLAEEIFLFRHFSMNQFTIDLHKQAAPGETTAETLARIGSVYRGRVLGW
jgi:hypothetical protein